MTKVGSRVTLTCQYSPGRRKGGGEGGGRILAKIRRVTLPGLKIFLQTFRNAFSDKKKKDYPLFSCFLILVSFMWRED